MSNRYELSIKKTLVLPRFTIHQRNIQALAVELFKVKGNLILFKAKGNKKI